MGRTGRPFAPVAARRDGAPLTLPGWVPTAAESDAPVVVARDHVLPVRARPEPVSAVELTARAIPPVDRLAPVIRRFRAPRRVWVRRALMAGVLVGSSGVLVSGLVLTSSGAPSPPAAAPTPSIADLRDELWGAGLVSEAGSAPLVTSPADSAASVAAQGPAAAPDAPHVETAPAPGARPAPAAPAAPVAPVAPVAPAEPTASPTMSAPPATTPAAPTEPAPTDPGDPTDPADPTDPLDGLLDGLLP